MEAGQLTCPSCGAPSPRDVRRCAHCNVDLQTQLCPMCYAANFTTDEHCRKCGGELADFRAAPVATKHHKCPRCVVALAVRKNNDGSVLVEECTKCGGLWLDNPTFQRIVAQKEQTAVFAAINAASPRANTGLATIDTVRYVRCPLCEKLMNRVNYGKLSGVIIDVCKGDGVWFDRDELQRIVKFIQAGGLDKARQREIDRLTQAQRERAAQLRHDAGAAPNPTNDSDNSGVANVVAGLIDVLAALL